METRWRRALPDLALGSTVPESSFSPQSVSLQGNLLHTSKSSPLSLRAMDPRGDGRRNCWRLYGRGEEEMVPEAFSPPTPSDEADELGLKAAGAANCVLENACKELEPSQATPGLMQDFVEKKCALGDHRLLTQQAYPWSWARETGFRSNNVELMGVGILRTDLHRSSCCGCVEDKPCLVTNIPPRTTIQRHPKKQAKTIDCPLFKDLETKIKHTNAAKDAPKEATEDSEKPKKTP